MEKSIDEEKAHIYNHCLENFKNIQELIKFADQKASGLLVVYGFLITIYINFFEDTKFIGLQEASIKNWMILLLGLVFCITMIVQIFYVVFKIIVPRKASNYENEAKCTFYYEHVAKMGKINFIELIRNESIDSNIDDVASQIYEISRILDKKYENIRFCIKLLILSVISLIGYVILLII
ncbi:hypothetical protein H9L25_03315 [Terrisporobacter mayombei]|nr:hypothetical protein [Terrisporobacter mayombei]